MAEDLPAKIECILDATGDAAAAALGRALDAVADAFDAPTATLHAVDADRDADGDAEGDAEGGDARRPVLVAVADRGVPEAVRTHTRRIPFGRGMAGICAERREAVSVCNLQTDASGVVRPGARETGVAGAIVVPVFEPGGARLIGTLGIGKAGEHTYTDEEQHLLAACAVVLAKALAAGRPAAD